MDKLETRTGYKIYKLTLNDMRHNRVEILSTALIASSVDVIIAYMDEHKSPWRDGQWSKKYAKDSKLEWFNSPWGMMNTAIVPIWVDKFMAEVMMKDSHWIN